ncbi:hypothetical protein GOP47_0000669 [Adiantum capillus-veneris]|uniref:Root cap n=1 Tax=Adiantum capillus-veneris TaxID=13818 RepID=A0A9D4VED3_ADICA|nr:hypothetical protein GOP47_0000669 [Adiantum capillus-veneris]
MLLMMVSVVVVGVWADETEEEEEVVTGVKGGVPMRRAAAAMRSLQEERRDPATQYVLLSNQGPRTRALCYSRGRCFLKRLTCPSSCPRRNSSSGKAGACFIDCTPSKCETSCKSRKAKCNGYGAVCYDPRFVGGDGVMFYFHGKANENFCLLSDIDLHINARFIGTRPHDRKRDFTWVDALGIMFDEHKLSIETKKLGAWNNVVDRFFFSYDGREFSVPLGESSTWQSPNGDVQIERTDKINSANINIVGLMSVDVNIVPITEEDNTVHKYQLKLDEDCFAHLDVQFKFMNLSSVVDGVLGQTYRPNFKNPVKVGTPMPIMGGENNFFSTSLFRNDCKANKFKTSRGTMEQQKLGERMFQCSSTTMEGGGVLCKR